MDSFNLRKYLSEGGIDQSQTQEADLEYKGIDYEIWYYPKKDGYYAEDKNNDIINKYAYFETQDEAQHHAEMEIDGFIEDEFGS